MDTDRKSKIILLLSQDPDSGFLLFALAKEYEYESDHQSAIGTYQRLLSKDPFYTGAYYHLSKQLIAIDKHKAAVETIHKGIDICLQAKAQHDASELRGLLEEITDDE
ncbi:MAG: hypothetical protein IPP04_05210 [Saprospiraceae bacterium]|nr:hypothetical protein [Saprospiraceae bacterium]MBK9929254.1 hypothetical protein [Saprospiraceae bacterium]